MAKSFGASIGYSNSIFNWLRARPWSTLAVTLILVVGILSIVAFVIIILPLFLVPAELGLTVKERIDAQNSVRTAGIAAVVALGGMVTIAFTAQAFALNRKTYGLQQRGQVADRYTKAIEQLGNEKCSIRIGGLYSLEQTARDEPIYRATILQVINAFIRDQACRPSAAQHLSIDRWRSRQRKVRNNLVLNSAQPTSDPPAPDVSAALTVFQSINKSSPGRPLNLSGANLTGISFVGMDLMDARLSGALLCGANFSDADLTGADLRGADVTSAEFYKARLTGTMLNRDETQVGQFDEAIDATNIQFFPELPSPNQWRY